MSAQDEMAEMTSETLAMVNEAHLTEMVKAGKADPVVLDHLSHLRLGYTNPTCEFCNKEKA